jgi:hypothetical protein
MSSWQLQEIAYLSPNSSLVILYHSNGLLKFVLSSQAPPPIIVSLSLQGKLLEIQKADQEGVDAFRFRIHVNQLVR